MLQQMCMNKRDRFEYCGWAARNEQLSEHEKTKQNQNKENKTRNKIKP